MHSNPSASQSAERPIIAGPVGDLEALVEFPTSAPVAIAVVCHPHPLFGGTMTNKVAHVLARTLLDLGAVTIRFNFRSVGRSAGAHDDGHGEVDDALAVMEWAHTQWPELPMWLGGFSFGAAVALAASLRDSRVERLVTVAPALRWLRATAGHTPSCPWLVVQGDRDELVNADEVRAWVNGLKHPPQMVVLEGVEHFFHGRLSDLRETVIAWANQIERVE